MTEHQRLEPVEHKPPVTGTVSDHFRVQRIARALLGLFFIALGLYTIQGFIVSLVWAAVFAIASWRLFDRARSNWTGRWTQTAIPLLFTAAIALIFLVPVMLLGLEAARESQGVMRWMESVRHVGAPVPQWMERLPIARIQVTRWWRDNMVDPQDVSDLFHSLDATQSMRMTQRLGTQLAHRSMLFLFSIVTLFFIFKDGSTIIHQSLVASRRLFGKRGESIAQQIIASVHGTLAGLVLVGIGEGIIMGFVYLMAGAPQPLLFGAMTGIAAMIPFFAVPAVMIVCALILIKGSTVMAIGVLCFGLIVIFVADHFIRPFLIGGATELPFLWVLLGILGGVESWGLLGLFLGPAVLSVVHLMWRSWSGDRIQDPGLEIL